MKLKYYRPFIILASVLILVSMACALTGGDSPEPTAAPTAETEPEAEEIVSTPIPTEEEVVVVESAPEGLVTTLDDVQTAVVQIVAEGTFIDPEFGLQLNAAGSGSGFIIDPSGIAITNNHVVTGAALLKVYVQGESRPRNATVLGVSECSDLAVIDIDGDGFPYLQWTDDEPRVGTDVYAAGYPLGDPEFTLTRGIISKSNADGETTWASLDYVIEHDATINPGNSGGPLINADGEVVGVNFASNNANQYFAIAPEEALPVIETLESGEDVNTLGINGQAVVTEDGFSGIWVSSVKSGSPADETGIEAGDIVTHLENIALSTDGTMADYCDVLRSHRPSDTLSVSVLRWFDQSFLDGQINGRELEVSYSFEQNLGDEVEQGTGTSSGGYSEYVTVTDDTGSIVVDVPSDWYEVDGLPWETTWDTSSGTINIWAASVAASPDIDVFYNSYDEPGVFFAASSDLGKTGGYIQLLDGVRYWYESDCRLDSRYDYEDALYEGKYDVWTDCGPYDSMVVVLSARPIGNVTDFLMLVEVKILNDADLEALDRIMQTFEVIGGV